MKKIEYIDRKTGECVQENPPGEAFLKFLYHNPFGKLPLHLLIKRKMVSSFYGWLMDQPSSVKKIVPFINEYEINIAEIEKKINEFTSFNDFFCRKLMPQARPLEAGVVSPADGKIIAFEEISDVDNFYIKGIKFKLSAFLGNEKLADKFKDGSMLIIRLAPNDYHRFHFPCDGEPSDCVKINGNYFSVSPYAVSENFGRVFCENKREFSILKTVDKGDVLLCPVGATMVGTIIETYRPHEAVKKGDEMGYFAFGGSSVVMLFEKGAVNIDADIISNTAKGFETFVRMGERIGE